MWIMTKSGLIHYLVIWSIRYPGLYNPRIQFSYHSYFSHIELTLVNLTDSTLDFSHCQQHTHVYRSS
jgi:hypothetical protein